MNGNIERYFFLCYIIFERIHIMDKNYYDILQINKNASPEIIEKAYKTLAKKYHPDLQEEKNKKQAEEILKELNEAYETLSDTEKKQSYDAFLAEQEQKKQNRVSTTNPINHSSSIPKNNSSSHQEQDLLRQQQLLQEQELFYQQQLEQARKKAYYDAYIQDLKNRGYKIRYKKTLKDYIMLFVSLVITILIFFLLWQIPFIRNFLLNLYLENEIIHIIIDFILDLFKNTN